MTETEVKAAAYESKSWTTEYYYYNSADEWEIVMNPNPSLSADFNKWQILMKKCLRYIYPEQI